MKTFRAHFNSPLAAAPPRACGLPASPPPYSSHSSYPSHPSHPQSAFTMIEIAIALGVIGFALVAIIGILPIGMNVQRETHQDSIIGQDGPFLLEAIRNGGPTNGPGTSTSLDFLTNYVESIAVGTNLFTNDFTSPNHLRNGQMILGLLSTPGVFTTARIRGLTGAATDQNGSNAVTAFRYKMDVEIDPFPSASANSLDYANGFPLGNEIPLLTTNLYELRLKFSWPVLASGGKVGPGRQTYRGMVSGRLLPTTNSGAVLWFFQPNTYNTL